MTNNLKREELMNPHKHLYAKFDSYVDPLRLMEYDYGKLSDEAIKNRFYYVHPECLGSYPEAIIYDNDDTDECYVRVQENKASLRRKFNFETKFQKRAYKSLMMCEIDDAKKKIEKKYAKKIKELDKANKYNIKRSFKILEDILREEKEIDKIKNPSPLTKIEKIRNVINDDKLADEVSKYMRKHISENKSFSLYQGMVERLKANRKKVKTYTGIENRFDGPEDFYDWIYNSQNTYRATKTKDLDMKRFEYQLDKDLLGTSKGKNYYSRETCLFLPKYINTMLEARNASRGDLPLGVAKGREPGNEAKLRNPDLKYYSVYISVLGYNSHHMMIRSCTSMHMAFWIYKLCKEYYVRRIGYLFLSRGLITREVYLELIKYEIKDDSGLANPTEEDKKDAVKWIERKELYNKIENAIQSYSAKVVDEMRKNVIQLDPLDHDNIMECLHTN